MDIKALTIQSAVMLGKMVLDIGLVASREDAQQLVETDANLRAAQEHLVVAMHRYHALIAKDYSETQLNLIDGICAKIGWHRSTYLNLLRRWKAGEVARLPSSGYNGLEFTTYRSVNLYWCDAMQTLRPAHAATRDTVICHPATIPAHMRPAKVVD